MYYTKALCAKHNPGQFGVDSLVPKSAGTAIVDSSNASPAEKTLGVGISVGELLFAKYLFRIAHPIWGWLFLIDGISGLVWMAANGRSHHTAAVQAVTGSPISST